jgi:hypothetical protein
VRELVPELFGTLDCAAAMPVAHSSDSNREKDETVFMLPP